jgi:DNA-binding IclR family transcriptional regulator
LGLRDLSAKTGFPAATTHRIVSALVARGYLQKAGLSHRYALAPTFLMLADGIEEPRSKLRGMRSLLRFNKTWILGQKAPLERNNFP